MVDYQIKLLCDDLPTALARLNTRYKALPANDEGYLPAAIQVLNAEFLEKAEA